MADDAGALRSRPHWREARVEAFRSVRPLAPVLASLDGAAGSTLAHDVLALCDVPHYASSAMDGWAVAGDAPWRLTAAGSPLMAGEAAPIVTGGLVPSGTHGVLRSEHGDTHPSGDAMMLERNSRAGRNEPDAHAHVRPAGEEAQRGDLLIRAGTVLNPAHVAVAAAGGHDRLPVRAAPRVSLVLTGDEVVPSGIPRPGTVRDTFGPLLPPLVSSLGGTVIASRHLPDGLDTLVSGIAAHGDAHVVITTGGTGASSADHLHDALGALGATILIDGVAMRPGGPTLLARLQDGRLVVGLPGNPLAAIMGLFTLARPAIAGLAGAPEPELDAVPVGKPFPGHTTSTMLVPYLLRDGAAVTSSWLGSGMLRGLADADGILVVPPQGVVAGESAQSLPLPWVGERR